MKDTQTETGAAPSDACGITLTPPRGGRFSHGNNVAARIAHDYLTLGKDVKLPVVPPEWYRAMEDAQDTLYAQNAHE